MTDLYENTPMDNDPAGAKTPAGQDKTNTEESNSWLPIIPLRGVVSYPGVQLSLDLLRTVSLKAFTASATVHDAKILLIAQKDPSREDPKPSDLYRTGTLAAIKHVVKNPQGNLSVVFEGICRVKLKEILMADNAFLIGLPVPKKEEQTFTLTRELQALIRDAKDCLVGLSDVHPSFSEELRQSIEAVNDPGHLADMIASSALIDARNKQHILEIRDAEKRLEALIYHLEEERDLLECEHEIQLQVRDKVDRNQKEFFLREQVKAIQAELGEDDDDEIREYEEKIARAALPKEVREKLEKELNKLAKTPFGAAEGTVIRSYLDTCLEFPYGKKTHDSPSVAEAKEILNADHDGLDKVKDRILEFVAVRQFSDKVKNQTLCLVGPPGVGKTSVAISIARALHRKYARVSLGGMHDEAEIRGHRKTYVGAMPGRIVNALIEAKTENPVIILDEIDKLANDFRGDPTSALLEVLDPEQNKEFRDNFMELPTDLSDCLFIATANSYDRIPLPLLDRMEVIELQTYTDSEKIAIAKNHLIGKQLAKNGMTRRRFSMTDEGILALIRNYTHESGVRNLEREIAGLIRKTAKKIAESDGKIKSVKITEKNLEEFLGKPKVIPETVEEADAVGIVNGLAYTQSGGDLLKVEVAVMEGSGKIELTGSLGDVMKESAKIAMSYVRTVADDYRLPKDFYKEKDLHVHFPEGAIPKDGPSAGVTMVTAMVSALGNIPVRRDIAMTGEVTLRGKVLAIGGLREKTLAAYRAGVNTVLIPEDNLRDLDEIDSEARAHLSFIPCKTAQDVLKNALIRP